MAKFYGKIGFAVTEEIDPGVWIEKVTERDYFGDVIKSSWGLSYGQTNGEVKVSKRISVMADPFAFENFYSARYVWYMGARWTVTDAEPQYPRLILTLGEVYKSNEQETGTTGYP